MASSVRAGAVVGAVGAALVGMAWGRAAQAEGAGPSASGGSAASGMTDAEVLAASQLAGEVVEIWDERPEKPFDRDTEVRLSGEELAARGATDLASALALLPDVTVRDAGRGGYNLDIRGARKGAIRILIDGVSVSDPYYGTFDLATIPITDIVQIRIATTPSSPIDGPGGPGGVVEVHTRDAIGPQLVIARLVGDGLPSLAMSGTARVAVAPWVGLRLALSGALGARDLPLPMGATVDEGRHATDGAARLEYRRGARRIALDVALDQRRYVAPPSDAVVAAIVVIDRETSARAQLAGDAQVGHLQLQGRGWIDALDRRSRLFRDAALQAQTQVEELSARRVGGQALATAPLGADGRWAASATIDHDAAEVHDLAGAASRGAATILELAGDGQYGRGPVTIDGAVGLAAPIGGGGAWLEGKVVARWRPRPGLELVATAARKGRPPALRERFDLDVGNPGLAPELASHGELRAVARPGWGELELVGFARRTTGTIRSAPLGDPQAGRFVNLGQVDARGGEARVTVRLGGRGEVGGSYEYIRASSDAVGPDPLDRLPAHRGDGWARVGIGGVSGLVRARYLGAMIDQGATLPATTVVEAGASGRVGAYLLVGRIEDVFDVRPATRSGYHTAGRVVSVAVQGEWR